jgi:carbon monoxide dehydrogenase subunit G
MARVEIESSFQVQASADRVYAFLLDVNRVVGCVPGAQLSEVLDPDTFRGRVRIKVGPVTVSYQGTARITERDPERRSATLSAEGRETTGSGSARATTTMSVQEDGPMTTVRFVADLTVVGRVAQFGRGIMEDVSRHLVAQMGDCIRGRLEGEATAEVTGRPVSQARGARPRRTGAGVPSSGGKPASKLKSAPLAKPSSEPAVPEAAAAPPASRSRRAAPASRPPQELPPPSRNAVPEVRIAPGEGEPADPLDALAVARAVAVNRLRRLSRRPALLGAVGAAVAAGALFIGWRLRRR